MTAVVMVLLAAVASYAFDLGPRWLGWEGARSPVAAPSRVEPPPELRLPAPSAAPPVATRSSAAAADPARVRRAIAPLLRDKDLGRRVAVSVSQVLDGTPVYDSGPGTVTPASTLKLVTAVAALASLGPDHRFTTRTVAGASPRQVVLVGGGDPLLARAPDVQAYPPRADIVTLGRATARALKEQGRTRVRLGYDATLFSGPAVSPDWPASYIRDDVVSPVSALWVDEGRDRAGMVPRAAAPARAAATQMARVLSRHGVDVLGGPRPVAAPPDAVEYATVRSATLAQIVQWTLEVSDNEAAEVLLRHVAVARGLPASFEGGATAVVDVLSALGVDASGERILDGSGLSRANRLSPDTLLAVLELASADDRPDLRAAVTGLPVAGFTGSLAYRFSTDDDAGQGLVRAKTGTLTGVHGLAGLVTDRDGTVLAFVAVADRVRLADTLDARETIDDVGTALADCSCGARSDAA